MIENIEITNLETAHRYFSANCFNHAWELLDKPHRSPADNDDMLQSSLASLWHWSQRSDCTTKELSIGCWQVSRVYCVLKQCENSHRYAEMAVKYAADQPPFYLAYAYEALARAEAVAGSRGKAHYFLVRSQELTQQIEDQAERNLILADLKSIL